MEEEILWMDGMFFRFESCVAFVGGREWIVANYGTMECPTEYFSVTIDLF